MHPLLFILAVALMCVGPMAIARLTGYSDLSWGQITAPIWAGAAGIAVTFAGMLAWAKWRASVQCS